MTLATTQDLDTLLHDLGAAIAAEPPVGSDGASERERTEARADVIAKAALAAEPGTNAELDAVLGPPALPPEPGEPGHEVVEFRAEAPVMQLIHAAGAETKMPEASNDAIPSSASPESAPLAAESTPLAPTAERKRSSFKALAERANQEGAARASIPPERVSVAPPSAPVPSRRSLASAPPRIEGGNDDSGVIDLNVVHAAAAERTAAAEKAAAASAAAASKPVEPRMVAAAKAVVPLTPSPKRGSGAIAGVAIAMFGLAAAFAIMNMRQKAPETTANATPPKPVAVDELKPPAATMAVATGQVPAAVTASAAAEPDKVAGALTGATSVAAPTTPGAAPTATAALAAKDGPSGDAKLALAAKGTAAPGGKTGDLASEMARAVGAAATDQAKPPAGAATPEPAAGLKTNLPEQPSQGSLQAAMGGVMGGAKACVAGASDASRAQVTFASSGGVTSVSVTGWAASNGKSGCVQAALKGAKVGAFSRPSFTFGVTIRP